METVFKVLTLIVILAVISLIASAISSASVDLCRIGLLIFIPICLATVTAALFSGSFSMGIMNALFTIAVTAGLGSFILLILSLTFRIKQGSRR